MKLTPPVIAFSGPSGSGKTTLIEKLIPLLAARGVRVGAIKRSHHRIDIDREGKDSHRFRGAGANPVVVTDGDFVGWMEKNAESATLEALQKRFMGKADIIIVEGFKEEMVPRFVFTHGPAGRLEDGVMGYITVSSMEPDHEAGVYQRDQVDAIAEVIIRIFL
ncbi:MAG: molybdopterin-guanine dinucleotide biosynthesis protein B [Nitrospinae bacterium]|nr:molybdopterin-guanine dinucleotide biosynthesis protein B [Nitrospinota bacterium]